MNKAKKYANKALDIYRQVLQKSEGNIYAANGIGAALAELGDYTTAQKIFMMVGYHSPLTRACFKPTAPAVLAEIGFSRNTRLH